MFEDADLKTEAEQYEIRYAEKKAVLKGDS